MENESDPKTRDAEPLENSRGDCSFLSFFFKPEKKNFNADLEGAAHAPRHTKSKLAVSRGAPHSPKKKTPAYLSEVFREPDLGLGE